MFIRLKARETPAPAAMSLPASRRLRKLRWISPLLRRILLVNALPLLLLVAALLYLDQYQNGLLEAEVSSLREQARIFSGALAESAVNLTNPKHPRLIADIARPLLYRITEPTPDADAKLFGPDGTLIADSRVVNGPKGAQRTPMPPPQDWGPLGAALGWMSNELISFLPAQPSQIDLSPGGAGMEWAPDVKEVLRPSSNDRSHQMPPYIRRTVNNQLLVTVSEPVERDGHTVGIILLTREAREVDASLYSIRVSILALFVLALVLTVLLSLYLWRTLARPILRLASAAAEMREGEGRTGSVPRALMARRDEVGTLAVALADSAAALWHRMDAIERFAADVAHEIKNPLSSIRSAIETLRRIDDPARQKQLLGIITDDVTRLNRLISDVSDASRVDAELSRIMTERVDVVPILTTLKELQDATRGEDDPSVWLDLPAGTLFVRGVEDRLVQVFRNLLSNAESFSPPRGRITVTATAKQGTVEITVDDQGPGIPEGKFEQVFDRFYSERPKSERFGQHSGLGLSISRQVVEALRGQITAENRLGPDGKVVGARFTVRLPAG